MRATPLCSLLLVGATCLATSASYADESEDIAGLKSQLAETQRIIDQLAAKVRELEAAIAAKSVPAPASEPVQPAAVAHVPPPAEHAEAIAAAVSHSSSEPGLPLHGFADVAGGTRNPINPDLKRVAIGLLDIYLTPPLGDRTSALFEVTFKTGISGDLTFDVERAQFGYQFRDAATLWLGRFHTPYGYYNTAFHHGAQVATSLRRPLVVQFERTGGVLPAHTVGLWLDGDDRVGPSTRLTYDVYAGNAQRIVNGFLDVRNGGNSTGDSIVGGNIALLAEDLLGGMRFGFSTFSSKIVDTLTANLTRVNNYGLYVVQENDKWENIAEFYSFANDDLTGATGTHHSNMGFVELAYRTNRWAPYVRYERSDFDQTDNYFAALQYGGSYRRDALGARFDLDLTSALKFELARTRLLDRVPREYDEALMQYAIRF
jgi:hypothetical protein